MQKIEEILKFEHNDMMSYLDHIEHKEIYALYDYIEYIKNLRNYNSFKDEHINTLNYLKNKQLDYSYEAFKCLVSQSYIAYAATIRIMIENYVTAACIQKFKDKEAWKRWNVWSAYKYMSLAPNQKEKDKFMKLYKELCEHYNVNYKTYITNKYQYGWLEGLIKGQCNFKSASKQIDTEIYKDFEKLSNYVHSNDKIAKMGWFHMQELAVLIFQHIQYTDLMLCLIESTFEEDEEYRCLYMNLLELVDKIVNHKGD